MTAVLLKNRCSKVTSPSQVFCQSEKERTFESTFSRFNESTEKLHLSKTTCS